MINFIKKLFSAQADTADNSLEKNKQRNFDILKYDGLRARQIGKPMYAEKCFKEALHLKQDLEVADQLVAVYIQLNKLDEATEVLCQAAQWQPDRTATYLSMANVYYMQEQYDAMLQAAQTATTLEAGNALSYYLQARAYHKLGDVMNTIATLTQALAKKEDFTEAYLMRARVLLELHQTTEAQADIDTLLQLDADNEEALLLAGDLQRSQGHTDEATRCYAQVTALNPFNEKAYRQQALVFMDAAQWDQAIEKLDEAIEIKPTAELYHLRGKVRLEKGDQAGSLEDVKQALALNPEGENTINGQFNNFDNLYKSNNPLG